MPRQARVYLGKSRVAHMVPTDSKGNATAGARCVRCGVRPRPWLEWSGTGGRLGAFNRKVQQAQARRLPLCKKTIQREN